MATIEDLATEYDMQPYELLAFLDLHHLDTTADLDDSVEGYIRDLLDNTDDQGYHGTKPDFGPAIDALYDQAGYDTSLSRD
ncbi:hypothetical protein [Catenuloplanes japonicus]|uniref:hypothetical protein n=1 Tax=Catenuloplanes japonicus TaxID=33876 RepID=UPI000526DC27|nr:hypothetical protein [Catenuloplanes japonicus]